MVIFTGYTLYIRTVQNLEVFENQISALETLLSVLWFFLQVAQRHSQVALVDE